MAELGSYNPDNIVKEKITAPKVLVDYSNLKPTVKNNYQNVISKAREVTLDLSQFLEDEPIQATQVSASAPQVETLFDDYSQLNNYK